MRLSSKDSYEAERIKGMKFPKLKGHVKIRLWNPTTHKTEFEYEGNNIVTKALEDIFAANYLGSVNYGSLMPLAETWFGGCLLYHDAFATTTIDGQTVPIPTDYYPQGDDVNALIAHAGDVAPASAAIVNEDLKRGSPVDITKTSNSIKFTWDWTTRQGNGVISAVALTHKDTGNAGIGNTSSVFRAFQPFASIGNLPNATIGVNVPDDIFAQYDDYHCLWFCIGDGTDYAYGHTTFETNKLTVFIRRLPYSKIGLFDGMTVLSGADYLIKFTVTLNFNLYDQPSYYFDYTNKKLWIFSNTTGVYGYNDAKYSKNTVHYAVIDCVNKSVDSEGTIVSDDDDLAPMSMEKYNQSSFYRSPSVMRNANIIKSGNYVYLPMSDGAYPGNGTQADSRFNVKGLKKININTQSDQSVISYNEVQNQFKSSLLGGGLIINSGRVVNGGVGYTCASQFSEAETTPCYACHEFNKPSSVITYLGGGSTVASQSRYIVANKLVHTTKFNLPASVEKLATQAMSLEYTLTEV